MANTQFKIPTSNPNAAMTTNFALLWVVNLVVIYLANMILPAQIVLGTMSLSKVAAVILSSGILAGLTVFAMPLFTEAEIRLKMILTPLQWMGGYLLINAVLVWMLGRFADVVGLGLASWIYVLGLAAVLDFAQGMTMMLVGEMQKKK